VNSENKTYHQSDWERCVICGSSVEPGHGAVSINHHGNTVNLCNPACLRTFAQEPDPYLARLAKRMRELQMQVSLKTEGQKSGQDDGFHAEAAYQVLGGKRAMGTLRYVPQNEEAC
jgi:ribosomal protein L24E